MALRPPVKPPLGVPDGQLHKRTRVLLYSSNLWYFGEGMLGPLLAVFAGRVGGDVLAVTWVWAAYLIVGGICTVGVGFVSDRWVRKETLIVGGYLLNTVFTFGYLLVDSATGLFVVQTGLGVASALATPTWEALYADADTGRRTGFRWGLAGGQADVITGVAILLGGLIVTRFSFGALFVVMGTVQAVATLYQARILRLR